MKKIKYFLIFFLGGSCISWEINPLPLASVLNSTNEFVIIKDPKQDDTLSFKELIKAAQMNGKRTIYLHEIVMAILTGSCEKDCNPNYDRAGAVFTHGQILPTQNNILVENTPSEYFSAEVCEVHSFVVPDTVEIEVSSIAKEKQLIRSLELDHGETEEVENRGTKRKFTKVKYTNKKQRTETNPFERYVSNIAISG